MSSYSGGTVGARGQHVVGEFDSAVDQLFVKEEATAYDLAARAGRADGLRAALQNVGEVGRVTVRLEFEEAVARAGFGP